MEPDADLQPPPQTQTLLPQQERKKLRILAISDNHASFKQMRQALNESGDIFIHAGDFTDYGREQDFMHFFAFLQQLKFKHKIVISGNHEISLDNGCISNRRKMNYLNTYKCSMSKQKIVEQLKKRCIYLEHEMVTVEGINIFGSPYSPYYVGNAFQYQPRHQRVIWDAIPEEVDILITHCPPLGILDANSQGKHAGSAYLKQICLQRKPKFHIFGHIHESAGMYKQEGIMFLNVSNTPTKLII